jgi:hypothetical protein
MRAYPVAFSRHCGTSPAPEESPGQLIITVVVRDANGQELAYSYSRENEVEALQAKVLTKDEARRIAVNIAQLPELLGKGERD